MKTTILAIAALFITAAASAQIPNDVQDFTTHGIHVILRSTKANQVIGVIAGFEGGLAYGETANASVAGGTAGLISMSGSDKYPKTAYRDSLARLSTSIAGNGNIYHMVFTLRTIRPNFNSAWSIFSDVLLHPHYDTLEAQKLQEQSMKAIEAREYDPESYSAFLADSIWKGNSPLNRVPTMAEVQNMTIGDLQNYRNAQFQRSRLVVVVVGDVSKQEIESKLASLEALPQGNFSWPQIPVITPQTDQYDFVPKPHDFPTTYVNMRSASAAVRDPTWWSERILLEILDKRLFDEVRTKRNLSYSPEAYPNGNYTNFDISIALQSIYPDSAAQVVFNVLRNLQNETVSPVDLRHAKEGRITTYYYIAQENLRQAQLLYTDQVEARDWRLFFRIVPETEKVTAAQVRDAANRYFHHLTFVLMGPEANADVGTPAHKDVYHFE